MRAPGVRDCRRIPAPREVDGQSLVEFALLLPVFLLLVIGLIEFSFVRNHLSGGPLVVLTLSLVVYAVHVPVLIAFTVARYTE